jgi:hypothetical protein
VASTTVDRDPVRVPAVVRLDTAHMRLAIRPLAATLFALLAPTAAPAAAQDVRAVGVTDTELRAILAQETDVRWNARGAAELSALYTAEGHNRIVGTPIDLRGRDAIRAHFTQSLARTEAALVHRTVVDEVQRVSPDVVAVEGRVWLERGGADSARTVVRAFGMNAVLVQDGGAWRVRWNRARPEPAVASR